jgi:transcriptional regulator GlxA family with amidase domain
VSALAQRQSFAGTDILRVIEQAKSLLGEQVDQPVNMEKLAADLGVGYSWFRRMFREYTQLSPSQYHLQLRINRACELLSRTTLPVAKVSERIGFESPYYFSHIFREKTGYSPRAYRAMSQTRPVIQIVKQVVE